MQLDSTSQNLASTKAIGKLKKQRARAACDACRQRKVRCGRIVVGVPRTNYRLDPLDCCKRVRYRERGLVTEAGVSPKNPTSAFSFALHSMTIETEIRNLVNIPYSSASTSNLLEDVNNQALSSKLPQNRNTQYSRTLTQPKLHSVDVGTLQSFEVTQPPNDDMSLTHYRFVSLSALKDTQIDGLEYLESKGCFHLPKRPHLDEIIRYYFYSVHPYLPVLAEEEFGLLCTGATLENDTQPAYSLLVLQAMLFAASAFTPLSTLKAIGFQNYHVARKTFYERAKLLYDFQVEVDNIAISQAALLLSFHSTPATPQNNTIWVSVGIQHARVENCHLYYCSPDIRARQRAQKKRMWWCCVIRDRMVALGMRRPIQITLDQFDFDQETVVEDDFALEIEHSEVYSAEKKRLLVKEFIFQCQLAVAVTTSLLVIYPLNSQSFPPVSKKSDFLKRRHKVEECTKKLAQWEDDAILRSTSGGNDQAISCETVLVYQDLTYLYYFSARIALCNYTMRMLNEHYDFAIDSMQQLHVIRTDLERGITSVCRKVTSLMTMGFVGHLHISVIALVALPLALLYLDSKLPSNRSQQIIGQQGFYSYAEFLRLFGLRFEFVDMVTNIISNAVHSAGSVLLRTGHPQARSSSHIDPKLLELSSSPTMGGWRDILTDYPRFYFHLLFLVDSSLSRGRTPSKVENSPFNLLDPSSPSFLEDKAVEITPLRSVVATNSLTMAPKLKPLIQEKPTVGLETSPRESNSERLQQIYHPPTEVQIQPVKYGHPFLLYDIFGFSSDDFELLVGEGSLEYKKKTMEEGNADQILDDIISFMFNPSPASGHF